MSASTYLPLEDVQRASDGHLEWLHTMIPIVQFISTATNTSFEVSLKYRGDYSDKNIIQFAAFFQRDSRPQKAARKGYGNYGK